MRMLFKNIKLVIFDLDDTLYPEIDFVKSGFRRVAEKIDKDLGLSREYTFKMLMKEFNQDKKFVFDRVLKEIGMYNKSYVQKLVEIYRTHKPDINLYDDAKEILKILKDKFYLGIITDGFPTTQRLKVEALGVRKYFNRIIYTWEKGEDYSKPSSRPFLDMLEFFSLSAKDAIYIGDNMEKDFKGPREIGMFTIRVMRDGIYKDALPLDESYKPDITIISLFDLLDLDFINK